MLNESNLNTVQRRQLSRFCLYGFLKNLQFFEPFLILAFLDKGLSFGAIGVLVAFRAICVNFLEIPSGAMADVWGRRSTMMISMLAYMASFLIFAFADAYLAFFPAMFMFAIGEAFRTGTHKAIIFHWVNKECLLKEKSRFYGLTRSWSKQGSSLNCIIAAALFIWTRNYRWIFLLTLVPYMANFINIWLYPKYLDGDKAPHQRKKVSVVLRGGLRLAAMKRGLRNLILENACFEGLFAVTKDFLQPTLKAIAVSMPFFLTLSGDVRTAVLVGIVYMLLNQLSSIASRQSHKAAAAAGTENRLARLLWGGGIILYAVMGLGFVFDIGTVAILAFVCLSATFNIWKPSLVSRFHDHADQDSAATTLSIANQGKTISVAVLAPLIGYAVDLAGGGRSEVIELGAMWPVALAGAGAAIAGLIINIKSTGQQSDL